jgi:hypothetical protein
LCFPKRRDDGMTGVLGTRCGTDLHSM